MNWKRTVGLALLVPALPGVAALTDEMTSDGSPLYPSVEDGARVYADECGGSVTMHISLSELEYLGLDLWKCVIFRRLVCLLLFIC